jgi:hypothetical protein
MHHLSSLHVMLTLMILQFFRSTSVPRSHQRSKCTRKEKTRNSKLSAHMALRINVSHWPSPQEPWFWLRACLPLQSSCRKLWMTFDNCFGRSISCICVNRCVCIYIYIYHEKMHTSQLRRRTWIDI